MIATAHLIDPHNVQAIYIYAAPSDRLNIASSLATGICHPSCFVRVCPIERVCHRSSTRCRHDEQSIIPTSGTFTTTTDSAAYVSHFLLRYE